MNQFNEQNQVPVGYPAPPTSYPPPAYVTAPPPIGYPTKEVLLGYVAAAAWTCASDENEFTNACSNDIFKAPR
ncbi:hypothetical protein PHJA_002633900 [Phtheirospermum japonicum]|uniref:Uncharacterized protein n=1 Tax=Phtheirospermum japonicum TaxID=374723 RepID=A0A830CWE7_9LAMI|nr:hypothetical protein PHJA_002633900 [Phtheirospermum japonicum]